MGQNRLYHQTFNEQLGFNILEEPFDTVTKPDIHFVLQPKDHGHLQIKHNEEIIHSASFHSQEIPYIFNMLLNPGRNKIELIYTNIHKQESHKLYNLVYLTHYDIIIDQNASSLEVVHPIPTFKTLTEALNSLSSDFDKRTIIFVKNGYYKEKLMLSHPNISLIGESHIHTVLTYDVAHGTLLPEPNPSKKTYGTTGSASTTISPEATGFTAENLTFENSFVRGTYNCKDEQAVALKNEADQSVLINCRMLGHQDTLYADANPECKARQYYLHCYISGDIDFVFGRAQAIFDDCTFMSLDTAPSVAKGFVTAASTWEDYQYGYLIINSRLLSPITTPSIALGRPWQPGRNTRAKAATCFMHCYLGPHILPEGWVDMGPSLACNARFSEFENYGPGAICAPTRPILSQEEASKYTLENIFACDYELPWQPHIFINTLYN